MPNAVPEMDPVAELAEEFIARYTWRKATDPHPRSLRQPKIGLNTLLCEYVTNDFGSVNHDLLGQVFYLAPSSRRFKPTRGT